MQQNRRELLELESSNYAVHSSD